MDTGTRVQLTRWLGVLCISPGWYRCKVKQTMDIKVLQINMRHSLLAAASLSQLVLDLGIDLILLQESYVHALISGR